MFTALRSALSPIARRSRLTTALAVCALTLGQWTLGAGVASAQQQPGLPGTMGMSGGIVASNVPPQFKSVTFAQRLDQRLPLDARFKDEEGRTVALGDFFGKRPVVLAFVYYQCPMLCSQVMNGISSALKVVPFTPGQEFEVVLVSFDPRDTPEAANAKKRAHLEYWAQGLTAVYAEGSLDRALRPITVPSDDVDVYATRRLPVLRAAYAGLPSSKGVPDPRGVA